MKTVTLFLLTVFALCDLASAQDKPPQSAPAPEKQITQQKPRIFIGESNSWEIRGASGSRSSSSAAAAGAGAAWIYAARGSSSSWSYTAGGARPQTAELVKTFGERCPDVLVNNHPQIADYAVLFNHEGGKGLALKRNKIAVFNRMGDSIFSDSTRSLGNSVKDACAAILADWQAHGRTSSADPADKAASANGEVADPIPQTGKAETLDATRQVSRDASQDTGENNIAALGIVAATWEPRGGAEILEIEPGSVAELAYLHVGDVITSFNGRPVKNSAQLAVDLSKRGKGSQVRLGYLYRSVSSGYVPKETVVILGENP